MSQYISISLISNNMQQKDAQNIAEKIISCDEITSIKQFYYPYYQYNINCKLPFLFGGNRISINALIDACSGEGITTDVLEITRSYALKQEMLDIKNHETQANKKLKSFITNHLNQKFKAFFNYEKVIKNKGIIYKLFWMIEYSKESILIDSVTKNFEILNTKKRA